MKRKKNFLLFVWAAAFLGLFAVQSAHADKSGFHIPVELAVYETQADSAGKIDAKGGMVALLSSETFDEKVTKYDLTSSYKSKLLLLCFKWAVVKGTTASFPDSTSAPVKVLVNGVEVLKYSGANTFATYFSDVYVIPFGSDLNNVSGKVEVDLSAIGESARTYEAIVTRDAVDDITALRGIWITDSIGGGKQPKTIFEEKAGDGDGGKLAVGNWTVSVKDAKGKADTLYFQKFDQKSTVHIIRNDRDTIGNDGTPIASGGEVKYTHVDSEIYKVKIEAGNKYTIAVTARDTITKGFYYVTLLDDTVKNPTPAARDTLQYLLKDLYLYEEVGDKTVRYNLRADTSGKVGFNADTLRYKVTAPLSAKVGYDMWDAAKFAEKKKEVIQLNYTKESGERFIEVRVAVSKANNDKIEGKGGQDTTYVIQIFNNDNYLKDLRLSYDKDGENPLELTSGLSDNVTKYKSVYVDWNIKSVSVWATPRDEKAKVVGNDFDTLKGKFHSQIFLDKEAGLPVTVSVPVWADDSTLIRTYTVEVRRKWNPNLESVVFSESNGIIKTFNESDLAKSDVFNVPVPTDVAFEDVEANPKEKTPNYYNVTKILRSVDGRYSYIIKVASVDRKEESKVDKTYTFNLSHPSSDAFLSYLSVTPGGELSPAFDPDVTEYSVLVPHQQNSINFVAVTRDEQATVRGAREHSLEVGVQIFPIVVTAEFGNEKTYTVTVTRESATGILLPGISAVYVSGQSLHVSTPAAERVSVYSAGGNLLYSLDKPAGKASVSGLPKGILIVKGSSGWVEKAVVR